MCQLLNIQRVHSFLLPLLDLLSCKIYFSPLWCSMTSKIQTTHLWKIIFSINPEVKNADLFLLKNQLFIMRTRSVFFFRTRWVLPNCVSGLQTLRPLNKSVSFISSQSRLIHLPSGV